MSVFNGENYVAGAIESILTQTHENLEFIIIDDGSYDNTNKIIKFYKSKDQRIKFFKQKNIGLTKSLNKAIKLSKGEYIARQDADDLSAPNRLEKQLNLLVEKNYSFCCSRSWSMELNRITPRFGYYFPKKLLCKFYNPFIHGTFMFTKSDFEAVGCYDENFYYAQDFKLVKDIFKNNYKIFYIKDPIYISRRPPESISVKHRLHQKKLLDRLRKN